MLNEDEDEEEEVPVKERKKSQLKKGYPANDRRGTHITKICTKRRKVIPSPFLA